MAISNFDELLARSTTHYRKEPIWGEQTAATAQMGANAFYHKSRLGDTRPVPGSLEAGVSAYIPVSITMFISQGSTTSIAGRLIDLGSLNIGTNVFTDGAAMPTETVFNTSRASYSPVFMEVTTAFNATPGNFTITYIDNAGNAAETTTSRALTASAVVGSGGNVTLNAGDLGVRDITTAARTGGTSPTGVIKFWGIIPFGQLIGADISRPNPGLDLITGGFSWHRLPANAQVGFIRTSGANGNMNAYGEITYVGDST